MEQNREIRSIARAFTTNGRTVSGYAIRFNEDSAFMGFTERINPSALLTYLPISTMIGAKCLLVHQTH